MQFVLLVLPCLDFHLVYWSVKWNWVCQIRLWYTVVLKTTTQFRPSVFTFVLFLLIRSCPELFGDKPGCTYCGAASPTLMPLPSKTTSLSCKYSFFLSWSQVYVGKPYWAAFFQPVVAVFASAKVWQYIALLFRLLQSRYCHQARHFSLTKDGWLHRPTNLIL